MLLYFKYFDMKSDKEIHEICDKKVMIIVLSLC